MAGPRSQHIYRSCQALRSLLEMISLAILIAYNSDLHAWQKDIIPSRHGSTMHYPCYDQGMAMPDWITGMYKEADLKPRE